MLALERLLRIALALLLLTGLIIPNNVAHAALLDAPVAWSNFNWVNYTYQGSEIFDNESSSDPSNGGSAVQPSTIDIASCSADSQTPGVASSVQTAYYDGDGDFNTLNDGYIAFRMRLDADPTESGQQRGYRSSHWNILIDVDNDGYKEFVIDLDGGVHSQEPDRIYLLYDDNDTQAVNARSSAQRAASDTPGGDEIDLWYAAGPDAIAPASTTNHARVVEDTSLNCSGDSDFWLEMQFPVTAFNVSGSQLIDATSPLRIFYSTSTSNTNPLQKDWMHDPGGLGGSGFTLTTPITFGDVFTPDNPNQTTLPPTGIDGSLSVSGPFTAGNPLTILLSDADLNTDPGAVETVTITVSNQDTGESEQVTLTETSANSGIFTAALSTADADGPGADNDGTLNLRGGQTLSAAYLDTLTSTGNSALIQAALSVLPGKQAGAGGVAQGGAGSETAQLPNTGFPPGPTRIGPPRKASRRSFPVDEIWLELPELGMQVQVVGVPQSDTGWDVSRLGNQAGYLYGTAYPTWAGNTVLAAHNYLSNGKPGPFIDLDQLHWGNQIVLHTGGLHYTYEVRSRAFTGKNTLDALSHKELDWVTLITCRGFDSLTGEYAYRVVVQAVLVAVDKAP